VCRVTSRRSHRRIAPAARGISRRDFLRYSGAGVASSYLLAACAGFTGDEDGGGGGGGETELIFSHGPDDSGSIQQLLDQFNKTNQSGITVRWRQMNADTGQYFDQLRTEFQAGGGDIDVISGDVIWPAQFAANGWILDVSDMVPTDIESDLTEGAKLANTYQGKLYGVPWFTDAGMLYYRKDIVDKAPETWDDLKQMALDAAGKAGTQFGFVWQGAQYEGGVCDGAEYIWTHGGNILDPEDDTVVVVDSPEAAAGLETARNMIEEGASPEDVVNYMEQQTHETFLRGDAVFARNLPYMYGLAADPSISKIKPNQIGVAALPVAPGGRVAATLGGWNLFINAATDKVDQAMELITFLAGPEAQKQKALKGSFLPTQQSLYDDKEITDKIPVIALAKDALVNALPRPVSPYYSDISLAMQETFNQTFKGEIPAEEATSSLHSEIQQIIEAGS
jgi:multiple sugar transport system substrate-binding protein